MEPGMFIATALAGAVLKEVATDAYKAVKSRLIDAFDLATAVEAVEKKPEAESARTYLASTLNESGAIEDAEVLSAANVIVAELEKLPDETRLGANLTVKDIKAEAAEFRRIRVFGGGTAEFRNIEGKSLKVEDIIVGDDRKR